MELFDFATWLGTVGGIVGLGLGVMLWAYRGRGSLAVLFTQAVTAEPSVAAAPRWQQGLEAFAQGDYRRARDRFSAVTRSQPDCGAAYHNLALALANLRQMDEAVAYLLQASERYGATGDRAALNLIKQHLTALKQYRDAIAGAPEPEANSNA